MLLFSGQALSLDNGNAKMVTNVSGLQKYQLHWNDRFPPGSILMIYVEANGINHRRAVGVDYIIVIKDSNDNVVNTSVFTNRYRDYRENDFVVYNLTVDETWEDGSYIADIHIFDLLNDSIMRQYNKNVTTALLNGSNEPSIPYMDRSVVINMTDIEHQYKNIIQNFYIDKYADKYPANRFVISNMAIDRNIIAPGIPITISIDVENTFYDKGTLNLEVMLDNKVVNNLSVDMGPYSTTKAMTEVPIDATEFLEYGNHTIELIPVTPNTVGFDLSVPIIVEHVQIEIPARLVYKDIRTDRLSYMPNETINATVTVENIGREAPRNVGLMVNDVLVEEKTVTLNYSEIRDINFSFTEKNVGQYKITINDTGLSVVFFVGSEVPVQETPIVSPEVEEKRASKIMIMVGLAIIIILIYIVRRTIISKGLQESNKIDIEDLKRRVM